MVKFQRIINNLILSKTEQCTQEQHYQYNTSSLWNMINPEILIFTKALTRCNGTKENQPYIYNCIQYKTLVSNNDHAFSTCLDRVMAVMPLHKLHKSFSHRSGHSFDEFTPFQSTWPNTKVRTVHEYSFIAISRTAVTDKNKTFCNIYARHTFDMGQTGLLLATHCY